MTDDAAIKRILLLRKTSHIHFPDDLLSMEWIIGRDILDIH